MRSEVEALILKKNPTKNCFDNKMANTGNESFLLTINIYNRPINAAIADPTENNTERKSAVDP